MSKHQKRSKRSYRRNESAKNWFFTCCGRFTYAQAQLKGGK